MHNTIEEGGKVDPVRLAYDFRLVYNCLYLYVLCLRSDASFSSECLHAVGGDSALLPSLLEALKHTYASPSSLPYKKLGLLLLQARRPGAVV